MLGKTEVRANNNSIITIQYVTHTFPLISIQRSATSHSVSSREPTPPRQHSTIEQSNNPKLRFNTTNTGRTTNPTKNYAIQPFNKEDRSLRHPHSPPRLRRLLSVRQSPPQLSRGNSRLWIMSRATSTPPSASPKRGRPLRQFIHRHLHQTRRASFLSLPAPFLSLMNPQIDDPDVCKGAVGSQAPILAHDLRSISVNSRSAQHFCSAVFGMCPPPKVAPHFIAFKEIEERVRENVKLELGGRGEVGDEIKILEDGSVRRVKEWVGKGRKPFKVVQLSDVHVDRSYLVRTF